jgi:hypothetical protein
LVDLRRAGDLRRRVVVFLRVVLRRAGLLRRLVDLRRDTFLLAIFFTFLFVVARRLPDFLRGFTMTSSCSATPHHWTMLNDV